MKRNILEISPNPDNMLGDVISLFEKLATENNNNTLDDLISKINQIELSEYNLEWNKLVSNYNKLKYFKTFSDNKLFHKPFRLFMEKIDSINQHYLKNIIFDPDLYNDAEGFNLFDLESLKFTISEISNSLHESLNTNDSYKKLEYTLTAYSHLVLIIEDLFGEKHDPLLDLDSPKRTRY